MIDHGVTLEDVRRGAGWMMLAGTALAGAAWWGGFPERGRWHDVARWSFYIGTTAMLFGCVGVVLIS